MGTGARTGGVEKGGGGERGKLRGESWRGVGGGGWELTTQTTDYIYRLHRLILTMYYY